MSEINFTELLPERIKINNLPDGSSIELLRREEFDVADLAGFQGLQAQVQEINDKLKKAGNKQAQLTLVEKLNEAQAEIIKFIAPGISTETLGSLKMGQRSAILKYWGEQNRPLTQEGIAEGKK